MKFFNTLLLPFIPNPFCYVKIDEDRIVSRRWGSTCFSIGQPDSIIRFSAKPGFWGTILGTGEVSFSNQGATYQAGEIVAGRSLRSAVALMRAKSDAQSAALLHRARQLQGEVPDSILAILIWPFFTALWYGIFTGIASWLFGPGAGDPWLGRAVIIVMAGLFVLNLWNLRGSIKELNEIYDRYA